MYKLVLILVLLNVGCQSSLLRPQLSSEINYQRDIKFRILGKVAPAFLGAAPLGVSNFNGDASNSWDDEEEESTTQTKKGYVNLGTFYGTGVTPLYSNYRITVYPPAKADLITVTSCHRETKKFKPKKGWFEKGYTFDMSIMHGVEDNKACSISLGVYEKKGGRHAWGLWAIENPARYKLPAWTKCNGVQRSKNGVSICQSKVGLLQEYIFDRPVAIAATDKCMIMESKNGGYTWEFMMPKGSCVVYFIDKMDPDTFHQANFFGYDVIPIRGVE